MPYGRCVTYSYRGDRQQLIERARAGLLPIFGGRRCGRAGRRGMHDGAAKGPKPIGFGNCWVVAGIVVPLSFRSRSVCLPVLARLWRPRHTGKIAHARELAELIAARYPDRIVHVVGDAAYVGERLRDVDADHLDQPKHLCPNWGLTPG